MFAKRNKRAEKYSLQSNGQRESDDEETDRMAEEEERRRREEEEETRKREGRVKTFLADERLLAGRRMKDKRRGWAEDGGGWGNSWEMENGGDEDERDGSRMPGVFGGANLKSKGMYV